MTSTSSVPPLRRTIYALLITVAAASVGGRILSVARVYEPYLSRDANDPEDTRGPWPATRPLPMPTLGDNDRSRWDTVRALVDNGTYAIGRREQDDQGNDHDVGIVTEDGWKTIDKVLRPDTQEFYSSKPPFLPTLVAGEYWLLKKAVGCSITGNRWWVVRIILLTVNWLPTVLYLVLLAGLVERLGTTDWGRVYVLAAACFGTYVTSFAITLNNHTVAACAALFALYPAIRIWSGKTERIPGAVEQGAADGVAAPPTIPAKLFLLAGFFAGFTACCELPAAAFAVGLAGFLLCQAPRRTLVLYLPAAAVPVAGFLVTNYLAIGQWRPAYSEFGGPWYQFKGSYWSIEPGKPRHGIDWAKEKEGVAGYAFHVLLGHHGLFALSPILLLALAGMALIPFARRMFPAHGPPAQALGMTALLTLFLTVIVAGFYITHSTRNYGGWTSGLRWLIWLTPLWLVTMLPVVDSLASRRWGRCLACILLAASVLSVSFRPWNPWRHPWLYDFMESQGWIKY